MLDRIYNLGTTIIKIRIEKMKFLFNDEMTINDCKISREEKRIEKFTLSLVRKVVKFWTFKSTSK